MAKIKLTESNLKKIVSETVKKMLNEATSRTKDYYFGGYLFVGVGRTKNGVPVYYSDHLPIEVKRQLGWRKSAKYGMCGQADGWTVRHALKELGLPFGNDEEEYYNSLDGTISEAKKKEPKIHTIDGVDYEETDVKRGSMLHPGFRWKDHESHNPEKSQKFRKRKDGYRYVQDYSLNPKWLHKQLTEASYDENGNFNRESHDEELREKLTREVLELRKYLDRKLDALNSIAMMAHDDRIKNRARAIMYGEIMNSSEEADKAYQLIKANRWDID